MSWLDNNTGYSSVARIDGELNFDGTVRAIQYSRQVSKDLKKLLKEFMEEMENRDLVQIEFPPKQAERGSCIYGGRPNYGYYSVEFFVADEDMQKYSEGKPFRLKVKTNVFSGDNDKDAFIEFFKTIYSAFK